MANKGQQMVKQVVDNNLDDDDFSAESPTFFTQKIMEEDEIMLYIFVILAD